MKRTGRGNQKAVYSTMGNILEMAENELEKKFTQQNAIVAIKAADVMTKMWATEILATRLKIEVEEHKKQFTNSTVNLRNIENKTFDMLPE